MRAVIAVFVASLAVGTNGQELQSSELLERIRAGDVPAVEKLIRSGVNPNSRDGTGATALMYAAAFAPETVMRLLLDARVDVNAANETGATALMWATHDVRKVRLLIAQEAAVNAMRADGMTALVSAALRGKTDVVESLLAAGADADIGRASALWALTPAQIAFTTNEPTMRRLLIPVNATSQGPGEWTPPALTRWVVTTVNSWRPQPQSSNADLVTALLDAGANPNEIVRQQTLSVPVLSRVAQLREVETMRVLLARGADPNAIGTAGLTPLMVAAVTSGDPTMVQLLLDRGAAASARDEKGYTALDWALKLGETDAARLLRRTGAISYASPPTFPAAVPTTRSSRAAVELAVARLQSAGEGFASKTRCISCHHQSLPAVAVKLASAKGVRIDQALASHPTQATLAMWARSREQLLAGNCSVVGFLGNVTYGLFALAEESVASNPETDAVTSCLSGLQKPDGSWEGGDTRPPLAGRNPFVYTALAVRALKAYASPGRQQETASSITRARAFVRSATPSDTQEEAFKLLGLVWSETSRGEIAAQVNRLLSLQHTTGGWSQLPTMSPDAYASGQALHALRTAGIAVSSNPYRKGVEYLLQTQLEDGTWHVRSRAIGFQPYIDSGFPYGPDQFISAAATAWAAIALSHSL